MEILDYFTKPVNRAIQAAREFSEKIDLTYVSTEILLAGLLTVNCASTDILGAFGVTRQTYYPVLKSNINFAYKHTGLTSRTKNILQNSIDFVVARGVNFVSTEHILYVMLNTPDCMAAIIVKQICHDFKGLLAEIEARVNQLTPLIASAPPKGAQGRSVNQPLGETQRSIRRNSTVEQAQKPVVSAYQAKESPLSKFGVDLTERAKIGKLDPVIGRSKEINRLIQTLSRRLKNSPLLIGEPGIGKSAVVEGLALAIVSGDVPSVLLNKTVFSLDMSGIIAGAKYRGEFEERFRQAIEYAKNDANIILFIDEIHNLVGSSSPSDGMAASEILKPMLARGELQLIGATTISEYRKYIEKDAALSRRFQTITVEPPTKEECKEILKGLRDRFEAHHKVTILDEAIDAAVELSERYITDRFLPDKAIDLIDEAAAHARLMLCAPIQDIRKKEEEKQALLREREYALRSGKSARAIEIKITQLNMEIDALNEKENNRRGRSNLSIDANDIAAIISEITSVPVAKLTESEADKLMNLEAVLHERVIGQDSAVKAVSAAVRRARVCVKDPNKPIGSFIFVGPTGVGKTELSKALAEALFGDEKTLIRIDMSEFMEKSSVSKLIGAPPGYVGYDDEAQLTEKVRRKPFSVVLFDEIEKAHPDIFNLMLQILDDGRLTDAKGRTVDFKNTVVIMTSNAGASDVSNVRGLGFGTKSDANAEAKDRIEQALKKQFRPEFLNRIDEVVVFNKLSEAECGEILDLLIGALSERLLAGSISITVEQSVKRLILEKGYDEEYGARPLKRTLQRMLEDALSERIIAGEICEGDTVSVVAANGKIRFINK